jgi:hypothetical protein
MFTNGARDKWLKQCQEQSLSKSMFVYKLCQGSMVEAMSEAAVSVKRENVKKHFPLTTLFSWVNDCRPLLKTILPSGHRIRILTVKRRSLFAVRAVFFPSEMFCR